jgi:type IV secretion system protein VirB1
VVVAHTALSTLLSWWAPDIGQRTMSAIIRVESGGHPLAMHDNSTGHSYLPKDRKEAIAWAEQLLRARHSVDVGLAQINNANFDKLGISVDEAFEPCANVHAGAEILSYDYRAASLKFGAGQFALRRAIGAYNSGSIFEGYDYVNRILAAAGIRADADFHVPDVAAMPAPRVRVNNLSVRMTPPNAPIAPSQAPSRGPGVDTARTPYLSPILIRVERSAALSTPAPKPTTTAAAVDTPIIATPSRTPANSPVILQIQRAPLPPAASTPAPARTPAPASTP